MGAAALCGLGFPPLQREVVGCTGKVCAGGGGGISAAGAGIQGDLTLEEPCRTRGYGGTGGCRRGAGCAEPHAVLTAAEAAGTEPAACPGAAAARGVAARQSWAARGDAALPTALVRLSPVWRGVLPRRGGRALCHASLQYLAAL